MTVLSAGTAFDTTIEAGGSAIISAGGVLAADHNGQVVVNGAVSNAGKLLASAGGLIDIVGVVSGGVTVIGNGKVEIAGSSSENVSFLSNNDGELKLDGVGTAYTGRITGFGGVHHSNVNQLIDFAGVNLAGAAVSFTSAASHTSGTLTVTDGVHSASVVLIGQYVTSDFQKLNDGSGHLKITDPTTAFTRPLNIPSGSSIIASIGDIIAESTVTNGSVELGPARAFPVDSPDIRLGAQTTLAFAQNGTEAGGAPTVTNGRNAAVVAVLGGYMAGTFAAAGHGGVLSGTTPTATPTLLSLPHA